MRKTDFQKLKLKNAGNWVMVTSSMSENAPSFGE